MAAERREGGASDERLIALLEEIRAKPPVIDPTANVLKLVQEAMLRQDDLRNAEKSRVDDVAKVEAAHRLEIRELESKFRDAAAVAESRRVDAVIAQQQQAVILASTRAELTASALAERVDTSAKALAERVDTSAKTLAESVKATTDANAAALTAVVKSLTDRIGPLEQFRYEQGGAKIQSVEGKADNRWLIGIAISAPSFLLAVLALAYALTK